MTKYFLLFSTLSKIKYNLEIHFYLYKALKYTRNYLTSSLVHSLFARWTMTPYILLTILYFTSGIGTSYGDRNRTQPCYGNQANYDMQKAMGSWYVVALVPETGFPKLKRISCYKMDVSETDEVGSLFLYRVVARLRYTGIWVRFCTYVCVKDDWLTKNCEVLGIIINCDI